MSDYTTTKARIFQWVGIVLILAVFAGAYWYFQVYGSTLNQSQNDLNTNGLVGMWSFNGDDVSGTIAYDRGTGGNNGTLTNAPQVTQGIVGQALNFFPNGSDTDAYVTIGDPGDGDLDFGSGDFSVGFWMKSNGYSSQGSSVNAAVAKHNLDAGNTAAGYSFYYASTNLMNFVIGNGTTAYTTTQTVSTTADNQWHQYTGVRSGSTMYLYIDGILVTSTTVSGSVSNGTGFCIGDTCGGIRNVNGSIDEVRVYNRAIAASEVASLYAQGGGTKSNTSVSQPQGTGRLDSGLAGYWKLDDGSGTSATDSSTNANTGTLTGGPAWTTGQIGSAVDFDGTDDYVTVADADALDVADSTHFTLTGWFNRDTFTADHTIIAKRNGQAAGDTGYVLYVDDANDDVVFEVSDGTDEYSRTSTSSFTSSGWQHVAAVFDDTLGMTIYINGTVKQDAASGTLGNIGSLANTVAFRSGAESDAGSPFDGKLDEIRLYNRVLSPDEVSQLYRLTAPTGVDTSLKGYWSFNGQDISGTTAYDRSGAGNTGTLTNGPTVTPGKLGQALQFDGSNDYTSAPINLSSTNVASASLWLYQDSWNNNDKLAIEFTANSATGQTGFMIDPNAASGNFQVMLQGDIGYSTIDVTRPEAGKWHHVVAIFDKSLATNEVSLYIDGTLQSGTRSFNANNTNNFGNSTFYFMSRGGASLFNSGKIDEVRIYNTALTAAQIQALYKSGQSDEVNTGASQPQGTGRLDSGLAGYWKMDDGSGTSATDSSVRGNNGTLNSGPTWTTGQIEGALNFDGADDNVTTAKTMANSGTVSVWVNTTATINSSASYYALYATTSGNNFFLSFNGFGGENRWDFSYRGNFGTTVRIVGPTLTSSAQVQGWHLLTATWDVSSGAVLYVDGQRVSSTSTTTSSFASMSFGLSTNSLARWLGKLDEVRMYDRILDASEVSALYRLTSPTGTDTSLKGYWSFNGKDVTSTSAYDRSGAGNTGTLTNGPAITEGKIGQALLFDGSNDYVTMGTSTALDISAPFTVSAWIKPTAVNGTYRIFTHGRDSCCGTEVSLTLRSPGTIRFDVNNDNTVVGSALSPGNWYHIVGTYDQTTVSLYVNGVLDNSASYTSAVTEYNNYSAIGAALNGGSPQNYFNGVIDEVRVYNRSLTAVEIAALYNTSR